MRVLAADVGGTNARLAIATVDAAGRVREERAAEFRSPDYAGLVPIAREFLAAGGERPERACFAVAGPVRDGECRATNLPWHVRAAELAEATGIADAQLINDFLAVGFGLGALAPGAFETLQPGRPVAHAPVAYLGAGTGLGMGLVVFEGNRPRVLPSEGGHASFAPETEREAGLLAFLRAELGGGHVSAERVLSGAGLHAVYRYLAATGGMAEADAVRAAIAAEDPAAAVGRHALAGDPLAAAALDLFLTVYGAAAGNLALTTLCYGGLYVAGGIAPRIVEALRTGPFLAAFHAKGRLAPLLEQVPVHVVTDPGVGLLGAAVAAWAGS
ncbi:MAG TPA: glucokinase [Gemmatimonadales bacterium]|nr:glucokinase [Gemmatimonadales bacterium]